VRIALPMTGRRVLLPSLQSKVETDKISMPLQSCDLKEKETL
jgi:hypothetical protein